MFAGFICMLGVTMVAAPGVPGGAIMASLGILSSMLGFNENDQALMIALYIAMDSFGTACNVTGDGALALIVDRWFRGKTGIDGRKLECLLGKAKMRLMRSQHHSVIFTSHTVNYINHSVNCTNHTVVLSFLIEETTFRCRKREEYDREICSFRSRRAGGMHQKNASQHPCGQLRGETV